LLPAVYKNGFSSGGMPRLRRASCIASAALR
jgi:hypothetical protein